MPTPLPITAVELLRDRNAFKPRPLPERLRIREALAHHLPSLPAPETALLHREYNRIGGRRVSPNPEELASWLVGLCIHCRSVDAPHGSRGPRRFCSRACRVANTHHRAELGADTPALERRAERLLELQEEFRARLISLITAHKTLSVREAQETTDQLLASLAEDSRSLIATAAALQGTEMPKTSARVALRAALRDRPGIATREQKR